MSTSSIVSPTRVWFGHLFSRSLNLERYRHKLLASVVNAESHEYVVKYLPAAIRVLCKQGIEGIEGIELGKFLEKCIQELNGLSQSVTDIRAEMNIRHATGQLETIRDEMIK